MSEVQESFEGRSVLMKHKQFAFFHPAAFNLAQILSDIPIQFVQVSIFSLVLYFMSGLRTSAGAFFTYWVIVFATTMVLTACFRAIGSGFPSFNGASKVSGLAVSVFVTYAGYLIAKPSMHRERHVYGWWRAQTAWFVWLYW
jgi:ATP-binding cassette subfamily G (WHITE) protein 2 (SNQ2)